MRRDLHFAGRRFRALALGCCVSLCCVVLPTDSSDAGSRTAVPAAIADFVVQDGPHAIELMAKKAAAGDAVAATRIGIIYEEGRGGVPVDYAEAMKWYVQAGRAGSPEARYRIGLMHRDGRGIERNLSEAARYLRLALTDGHAGAAKALGLMILSDDMPEDLRAGAGPAEAVRLLSQAAQEGDVEAQLTVARAHMLGRGVPRNPAEATRWYTLAADQDSAEAQNALGQVYETGIEGIDPDMELARAMYQRAALHGFTDALISLGDFYVMGIGGPTDARVALRLYRQAAVQGNATAMYRLGGLYERGLGVQQSLASALRWYRAASETSPGALYAIGLMLRYGIGVDRNADLAEKWIRAATSQGYGTGFAPPSPDAEGPPPDADPAVWHYQQGIRHGLGYRTRRNPLRAFEHFKNSAELGNPQGAYSVAIALGAGIGVSKDKDAAVEWFAKSAKAGNAQAETALAALYANGKTVERDVRRAFALLNSAAKKNFPPAQYYLGLLYERGLGTKKSPRQALKWFRLAAARGDADAQARLGRLYEDGIGVDADPVQAFVWYTLAIRSGNEGAAGALERLRPTLGEDQLEQARTLLGDG